MYANESKEEKERCAYNVAMLRYLDGEYTEAVSVLNEEVSDLSQPLCQQLRQKIKVALIEHPTTPPRPLSGPLWIPGACGDLVAESQRGDMCQDISEGVANLKRDNEILCDQANMHERLLNSLLPAPIIKQLQLGGMPPLEEYPSVSVLFADIVGFTHRATTTPARHVVQTLVELFGAFDALSEADGITKIKTIGDCYMAATGVPVGNPAHADVCVSFAMRMLGVVHAYNLDRTTDIAMRIGINSGSVIGGIIGTRQFCFDLWGDTVNVAARMESTSRTGLVQVSDATHALLSPKTLETVDGIEHLKIQVKGKGFMSTHLITPPAALFSDTSLRAYVKKNAQASEKFQALFLADYFGY
eukprot:gene11681-18010_t